jgi:type VI secretion system protein VasD
MLFRYCVFAILLALIALSAGCATPNGTNANVNLQAAKYLNPDIDGNPSPVVVSFYELSTPFAFKQANFYRLTNNAAAVLGTNLIDKQTFEMRPGSNRNITQFITPNAHYLGITAAYRNIDQANWRSIIKIPPKAKSLKVLVSLESQGLTTKTIN